MVLCEIDSNAILVETMKYRIEGEMIKAYLSLLRQLKLVGINPSTKSWTMRHQKNIKRLSERME